MPKDQINKTNEYDEENNLTIFWSERKNTKKNRTQNSTQCNSTTGTEV
jgi:hypothetical protein